MFKLVIQDDEGKTTVVPLIRDELTIGRKEGNTIRLTERNVSRRHARVIRHNGSITIEDLDSYNGIRVNGSRIAGKISLKESDRVQIGDYLIEIKSEAAAADKDTISEATQPIERIDPMGTTPIPESLSAAVTVPVSSPPHPVNDATEPITAKETPIKPAEPETASVQAQPVAQPVGHSRLVVLSTAYAGKEFELDKPAMVIGRTDDNDVWINHRSISRHHAKIVRENGRYAIVDLQSSNGVRVNGEEYGKVELRRADVIDLGHVRMRFVEAGEEFVFGRDALAMEIEPERGSRGVLWALLALIVLAAGGGVMWYMQQQSSDDDTGQPTSAAGSTGSSPNAGEQAAAVTPPAVTIDAAVVPEVETPTAVPATGVAAHLKAAEEAIKLEEWAAAHEEAIKAQELDPTNARAQDLARQAKSELLSELAYGDFQKCPKGNYRCVIDAFEKLDPLSVYRDKAQPKWDQAREQFIREKVAAARKLAAKGKCDDVRRLATSVASYWEEAKDAVAAVHCADETAEVVVKPVKPPEEPVVRKPAEEDETESTEANSAEDDQVADDALKEAQAAAKASQYGKALRLCEKALSLKKTQDATVVCAIASCNLRSEPKAKKYISRIRSTSYKGWVRQVCMKNGVSIPP